MLVYSILDGLYQRSEELLGCEMIYQLVEFTKDNLTDNNLPSGECAICLSAFQVNLRTFMICTVILLLLRLDKLIEWWTAIQLVR